MTFHLSTPAEILHALGVRLREQRLAQSLTQRELAQMAGLSLGALRKLESDGQCSLETLVRVYGESEQLQERANLVMVMGTRDDLLELPKSQQAIINNVLCLIDRYDLYGKVAYPKTHMPDDVPELYRLATSTNGVFINPALTEPFGLTLLEAGATGLPIVATNDGGPRDIIANCRNGLLVDPLDDLAIEHALLRVLTEPQQWTEW